MSVRLKDVLLLGVVLYISMHIVLAWRNDNSNNAEIPWQLSSLTTSVDKLSYLGERSPADNDFTSTAELPENEPIPRGQVNGNHAAVAEQSNAMTRSLDLENRREKLYSKTLPNINQYTPLPEPGHTAIRQPHAPTLIGQQDSLPIQSHQTEIRSQVPLENQPSDFVRYENRHDKSTDTAYRNEPTDLDSLDLSAPDNATVDVAALENSFSIQQSEPSVEINDLPNVLQEPEQSYEVLDLNSTSDRMLGSTESIQTIQGHSTEISTTQNSDGARRVRKVNWEEIEPVLTHVEPQLSLATYPALQRLKSLPATESQALGMIEKGKALATRGAYFAAKIEFVSALELVAQSNDRYSNSQAYTDSLAKGLTALKESGDFVARVQGNTAQARNVQLVLASHSTRIIDPSTSQIPTPQQAIDAYSDFAKPCLSHALGESMAGSSALYHLSRLLSAAPEIFGKPNNGLVNVQQVLLLASMDAFPGNFDSANEMGVISFAGGQFEQSVHWFQQAIRISGGKQLFWQNLAEAHRRAGNATQNANEQKTHFHLAQLAMQESQAAPPLRKTETISAGWVSPEQFQHNAAVQAPMVQPQESIAPDFPTESTNERQQNSSRQPRLVDKIKDWF